MVINSGGLWIPLANSSASPRAFILVSSRSFVGDTLPEALAARDAAMASGKTPVDPSSGITEVAISSMPQSASPVQAGIATGLATGIVLAFVNPEDSAPMLYNPPLDSNFADAVRKAFVLREPPKP